jgi:hypothetical protein
MADLMDLGSLLPMGYTAPDVQGILGGEDFITICSPTGSSPNAVCTPSGSAPSSGCGNPGGTP